MLRDKPVKSLTVGSLSILYDMIKSLKRLMETTKETLSAGFGRLKPKLMPN